MENRGFYLASDIPRGRGGCRLRSVVTRAQRRRSSWSPHRGAASGQDDPRRARRMVRRLGVEEGEYTGERSGPSPRHPHRPASANASTCATPTVDLETHIQDLLGCAIKHEELKDFVLIGHSYGGMVATGVADRVPDRVSQLIYLDAFVPRDGQSLLDLQGPDAARGMRERVKAGDGWRVELPICCRPIPRLRVSNGYKASHGSAGQILRGIFAAEERRHQAAARIHLLLAPAGGQSVPCLRRAGKAGTLGLPGDRRESFAPRDRASGARRSPRLDHGEKNGVKRSTGRVR